MNSLEKRTVLKTDNAPKAVGPYSVGIKTGSLVFLSGQLGLDPLTAGFAPGGVEAQTRQSLQNLQSVLVSCGLNMKHVVKTTVFLQDMADFAAMNAVYATFFLSEPPARSTVQVAGLPMGGLVEIEAIALIE